MTTTLDEPVAMPEMSQFFPARADGDGEAPTGNQQVVAKLLVSNSIAGSIIGKSGSSIDQLQRSSGARIQLSRSNEFYPGTTDRVLLLSGSLHSVLTAVFLILDKTSRDSNRGSTGGAGDPSAAEAQIKLALARRLCGMLIGHQGQTVRDFITDSAANIRVQSLSELTPSDPERTITVSGARDQVLRAIALLLNALSINDEYAAYMETTMQLATSQGVVMPPRARASSTALASVRSCLTFYLSDEDVGAILGKKGQNIADIQKSARVVIKISDRSKMDPSVAEREVAISGPHQAVKLAEAMIAEKLTQAHAKVASRDGDDHGDQDL